jgi:CheY-like chemotaxis protein
MPAENPPVVAVFNTSPDVIDLLRLTLEGAGFVVVTLMTFEARDGTVEAERFLQQHDPDVVVYDIALPYEANWRLFCHLRQLPGMRERPIVLTTTNARHVQPLAREEPVFEIVGKPYDLGQLIAIVRRALAHGARGRQVRSG